MIVSLCLLLLGCSSQPALPELGPDATILAFGDSLTYGTGVEAEQSYPAVLARLTGLYVVNAGVPGEVSAGGLVRLPALLESENPDLLILCHGGNDMLRKQSMAALAENLKAMIHLAGGEGVPVLLIAVPRPGLLLSAPEFYEKVAGEMQVPIEDEVLADILSERSLKSDTIHPNAKGYRLMAEAVFNLMRETGAIR